MADIIPLKFQKTSGGAVIAPSELNSGDTIPAQYLNAQAPNLYGTYAARPAATAVKAGTIYYASDTLECYRSNGSAWLLTLRGGAELGHSERTTSYPMTNTAFIDVPGLAVDYTAGEGAAFVSFGGTGKTNSAAIGVGAIFIDGVQMAQILYTSTNYLTMSMGVRVAGKTPGTVVQARIRGRIAGEGSEFSLLGDAVDRPFIRVVTG